MIGIFGYVDVVLEGDLESWNYFLFEVVLEDGKLYGRGI